jgi:hypothetical protein
MSDAHKLFDIMLREYNEALSQGCDSNGAYDCMRDAGAEFLQKLDAMPAAPTRQT